MNINEIESIVKRLEEKIDKNTDILIEHQSRTAANEARLELMEGFLKESMQIQQSNFKDMLIASEKSQLALNRQLKISLTIFASLASLVTALVAFLR